MAHSDAGAALALASTSSGTSTWGRSMAASVTGRPATHAPAANLNVQYQSGIWVPVKVPGEVSATAANPNDDTAL